MTGPAERKRGINPTKAYLQKYRALLLRYNAITSKFRTLEARATNTAARIRTDCVRGGGPGDIVGDTAAAVADAESLLLPTIRDIRIQMQGILDVINAVPDEKYKMILTQRYVCGESWEEVSAATGYSKAHINRLHGWALLEVKRIMDA